MQRKRAFSRHFSVTWCEIRLRFSWILPVSGLWALLRACLRPNSDTEPDIADSHRFAHVHKPCRQLATLALCSDDPANSIEVAIGVADVCGSGATPTDGHASCSSSFSFISCSSATALLSRRLPQACRGVGDPAIPSSSKELRITITSSGVPALLSLLPRHARFGTAMREALWRRRTV
jgi:hypothetical protein